MPNPIINRAISIAQLKFGGSDGIFNTACFQSALKEITGHQYGSTEARIMLCTHPHIVELSGGCHWQYRTCVEASGVL